MDHEIGIGKHAAADKRRESGEQTESNHKSADELDPTADLSEHFVRAGHSTEKSEHQLKTVTGKHQANYQPHDAVNRIGVAI